MTEVRISNDEIDIVNIIKIVWNSKLIILSFAIILFVITFGYHKIFPNTVFTAITTIKPVTNAEMIKYKSFNSNVGNIQNHPK